MSSSTKYLLIIVLTLAALLIGGCVHSVTLDHKVGYESREKSDQRASCQIGAKVGLPDGVKIGAAYRWRISGWTEERQEHGVFLDLSVPLYRKGNRK